MVVLSMNIYTNQITFRPTIDHRSSVMLNDVKHLYNKDSSLALRMTTKFSE